MKAIKSKLNEGGNKGKEPRRSRRGTRQREEGKTQTRGVRRKKRGFGERLINSRRGTKCSILENVFTACVVR